MIRPIPDRPILVVALAAFAASGCGVDEMPASSAGTAAVDTLANGRIRVVNEGPAWGEAERWRAVEDLRVGTVDGTGPDQFGQIAAVKADAAGRVYVLDYMAQEIRVFEAGGAYSHTIGRRGQGPGELESAAGLNWGPEGNLWVWDTSGRFSIFTPAGEFVESRPRRVSGVVFPWRGEFDTDGSLVDWGLDYPGVDLRSGEAPTRIVYYPVRFSGDFERGDTLPTLHFDFEMTPDGDRMVFSEGLNSFQDRGGAVWFAHNKTFRIYRRTLGGDTTLELSIPATPPPVTQADIDSIRALYTDRGRPEAAPGPEGFSADKPMIRRMFSDERGHLFVLSEQEGVPLGTFVDVFRDDGRYLGRVDLPAPVNFPYPPPFATDTHLYYVTANDLDVEFVVRVRLEKPAA